MTSPAQPYSLSTALIRFPLALALFALCSVAVKWAGLEIQPAWRTLLTLVLLASMSVLLMLWSKQPFKNYGFTIPSDARWFIALGQGIVIGMVTSGGAFIFGFTGMAKLMKSWSFLQIILVAWLCSSLVEELFCRGWFQSGLPNGRSRILWSAALFGSLHLMLFRAGIGVPTAVWIVIFTTVLGYVCARLRDNHSSWLPAFVAHFGFNIGGLLSGIIYTIGHKIITGHLPSHL